MQYSPMDAYKWKVLADQQKLTSVGSVWTLDAV